MNLRKLLIPVLSLLFVTFSCKDDDDVGFISVPLRDRQEVYDENVVEIEEYLETHFFNYEDFDDADLYSAANDEFEIVFDTIADANSGKTPIMDYLNLAVGTYPRLDIKTVNQDDIDYNLYILKVREGLGDTISPLDKAAMLYEGTVPDATVFDSQVIVSAGQPFNLTGVGSVGGVVAGFREGIIEFKTSTGFTENTDGSSTYNDHGIGAVFMPSGLGYFASPPSSSIPQYSPLFFKLRVLSRSNTDWDVDGIPSHLEHPDGDFTEEDDNTDGDLLVNFIDNDDDGDGVLTRDEVQQMQYEDDGTNQFMSKAEAQSYFDANAAADEIFISIEIEQDGTYTLNTLIVPDDNNDGTPNYLDSSVTTEID